MEQFFHLCVYLFHTWPLSELGSCCIVCVCTGLLYLQELLEFWLRIQHGMEADTLHFQDSVRKVAALTHDLKHISILLDVLISEVCYQLLLLLHCFEVHI